jgi:hypothetical protein
MADRRGDDRPLAPHRPLSGTPAGDERGNGGRGSLSKRMAAAMSAAGSAVRGAGPETTGGVRAGQQPPQSATSGSTAPGSTAAGSTAQRGATKAPAGRTAATKQSAARTGSAAPRPRGTRRARLRLVHLDPWSVMKTAFLLSVALGIVTVVAVAVVWSVLGAAGVWDSINKTVSDVLGGDSAQNFDVKNYVGTSRVLGFTMVVAVVDVVLITAISTLGAFLYNLAAALLGGVEVTLAEDDR